MWKLLGTIKTNIEIVLPTSMVLGFFTGLGLDAHLLDALIGPLTILMVYPMMIPLRFRDILLDNDGRLQGTTLLLNIAVIPVLAYCVGWLFFRQDPYMLLGILLIGIFPTSSMTVTWTGLAHGKTSAAVKMTILGLIGGCMAMPFFIELFMGAHLDRVLTETMAYAISVVIVPMVAGWVTQRYLMERMPREIFEMQWVPRCQTLSTIGVVGVVFIVLAQKAEAIVAHFELLPLVIAPVVLFYAVNYVISFTVGKFWLERENAIALVFGSVMRNLTIALAISLTLFDPRESATALVISIAYIVQVESAAWMVKMSGKIYQAQFIPAK
jgi:ACR3 family arsenite transporter